MSTARAIVVTLRPRQWVKNLFVVAPLVFSKNLFDAALALESLAAFAVFCALSGAVYAFNDVRDAESDRRHPTKCRRPVAAGTLGERAALALSALLAAGALAGAALISLPLCAVAGGYLVNNLAYSLYLKRIAFLDVLMIATGFLLRVVGGALAIDVPVSRWLLACTALLAALLGFGKRASELASARRKGEDAGELRAALGGYSAGTLRIALGVLAAATCAAYALYTQDERTVAYFGTRSLGFTAPFCVLGIFRFLQLTRRADADSPTDLILRDLPFLANLLAWGVAVLAILYWA